MEDPQGQCLVEAELPSTWMSTLRETVSVGVFDIDDGPRDRFCLVDAFDVAEID